MPQIDFTTWSYFNILTIAFLCFIFIYGTVANSLLASHKLMSLRCHIATIRCLSVIYRLLAANQQEFLTRKSWLQKNQNNNKKN